MKNVYAIKDSQGHYIDKNSIYYDKKEKKVVYRAKDTYINSTILYSEDITDETIQYLTQKAEQYNLNYTFTKEFIFKSDC